MWFVRSCSQHLPCALFHPALFPQRGTAKNFMATPKATLEEQTLFCERLFIFLPRQPNRLSLGNLRNGNVPPRFITGDPMVVSSFHDYDARSCLFSSSFQCFRKFFMGPRADGPSPQACRICHEVHL